MILDSKLTFLSHIKEAIAKARKGIGIIRFLSKYVSSDVLNQVYKLQESGTGEKQRNPIFCSVLGVTLFFHIFHFPSFYYFIYIISSFSSNFLCILFCQNEHPNSDLVPVPLVQEPDAITVTPVSQ